MNQNKHRLGSVHLVVVILITGALIGSLGYVFWNNYVNKTQVNKTIKDTRSSIVDEFLIPKTETEVPLEDGIESTDVNDEDNSTVSIIVTDDNPGTITDHIFETGLSINFPTNWKQKHEVSSGYSQKWDSSTITSPDGEIEVSFSFNEGMMGMPCFKNNRVVQISTDSIPAMSGVRFVSFIERQGEGTYGKIGSLSLYAGIQKDNSETRSVGIETDNFCNFYGSEVFHPDNLNNPYLLITLNINVIRPAISKDDYMNGKGDLTIDDINKTMQTENFKIAKQIIQSLHIK